MKARCLFVFLALLLVLQGHGFAFYNPSTGRWLSKDPIEESGGNNLYAFCVNNPVIYFDPFGQDFIAVGANPALHTELSLGRFGTIPLGLPGQAGSHLSLSYWKETKLCIGERATKDGTTASSQTNWTNPGTKSLCPNDAQIHDVVQLDFKFDFKTSYTFTPAKGRPMLLQDWVPISRVVKSNNGSANKFEVAYADTKERQDAGEQWAKILYYARRYAFAEPGPIGPGYRAQHWPNSEYGILVNGNGNNSNTFIKAMLSAINRRVPTDFSGPFPGNDSPMQVNDSRPIPIYVGQ